MEITIRHIQAEEDAAAVHEIFSSPSVFQGTMTDYVFREGDYINAHVMGRISPHRRRDERMAYQEDYAAFG